MSCLRFVVARRDPDSGRHQGVFYAAFALGEQGILSPSEQATLRASLSWFNAHLPHPTRYLRKRNHSLCRPGALSWFKHTARAHLREVRQLVALLEAHASGVSLLVTDRPGYVVYEDAFQVMAEPFADTFARPQCATGGALRVAAAPCH